LTCTKHTVIDFLRSYEMDYLDVDFDSNLAAFLDQMDRGLAGDESTLEMIPTFLSAANQVPTEKQVIVADAGGTNFRVATVSFDKKNNPVIENLENFPMPGIERELSSTEFFEAIASYFKNVTSASEQIGFCFSYPAEMLPSKDGRLVRLSKEIKAPEVVGQMIGENLTDTIVSMGLGTKKKIVLLNDTVATLLAGVGHNNKTFSSYIGFILGTGTNTSYIEQSSNITKQDGLAPDGNMIINVESGGMGKVHSGKLDAAFDESTTNPGVHTFEKMISGAYLGPLVLLAMQQCADDGLLSAETTKELKNLCDLETKDLSDFMCYPYGNNPLAKSCAKGEENDVQILYAIADRMVERAAKLTAINLSAMAIKTGEGTDPTRPICIVADGTTFYHMKNLRSHVGFYLKKHLEDQRGIYTETINVENAPVIGAAIAGLIN
jgi:hexokinase